MGEACHFGLEIESGHSVKRTGYNRRRGVLGVEMGASILVHFDN